METQYDLESFLQFLIQNNILRFGHFTLKSGRQSNYFFDSGLFNDGKSIFQLGNYYADLIIEKNLEFDLILGPAYKGIPLAVTTAISLWSRYHKNVPYVLTRKEMKDHGEGGLFIGALNVLKKPDCKILIVDDVITAGTTTREMIQLLTAHFPNAQVAGVLIAFDREEVLGSDTAVQKLIKELNIPIYSVARYSDLSNMNPYIKKSIINAPYDDATSEQQQQQPSLLSGGKSLVSTTEL